MMTSERQLSQCDRVYARVEVCHTAVYKMTLERFDQPIHSLPSCLVSSCLNLHPQPVHLARTIMARTTATVTATRPAAVPAMPLGRRGTLAARRRPVDQTVTTL
jgi:hypothetical protein